MSTDNMDQGREYWHDRFERQKTVRLATLRECAEELYEQRLQIIQRKDMIYWVAMPGFNRNFTTIRAAGLAITSPETYERLTQASVPVPPEPKQPGLVPFLKSLFGLV